MPSDIEVVRNVNVIVLLRNITLLRKVLKLFNFQVGGSRKYDLESTNWTDSSLTSSVSLGLDEPYSAAEGRKSELC